MRFSVKRRLLFKWFALQFPFIHMVVPGYVYYHNLASYSMKKVIAVLAICRYHESFTGLVMSYLILEFKLMSQLIYDNFLSSTTLKNAVAITKQTLFF